MPKAQETPGKTLLNPKDHTLISIDFQSQMAFATKSMDPVVLRNNAACMCKRNTVAVRLKKLLWIGAWAAHVGRSNCSRKKENN